MSIYIYIVYNCKTEPQNKKCKRKLILYKCMYTLGCFPIPVTLESEDWYASPVKNIPILVATGTEQIAIPS